jgi:hypothetical protein
VKLVHYSIIIVCFPSVYTHAAHLLCRNIILAQDARASAFPRFDLFLKRDELFIVN